MSRIDIYSWTNLFFLGWFLSAILTFIFQIAFYFREDSPCGICREVSNDPRMWAKIAFVSLLAGPIGIFLAIKHAYQSKK